MHAIYLFRGFTNDINKVVDAFYSWIEERGDSNNWYDLICAVNSNGDFVSFNENYNKAITKILDVPYGEPTPEEIALRIKGEPTINDFKRLAWEICIYEVAELYVSIMSNAKKIKSGAPYRKFFTKNLKRFKFKNNSHLAEQFIKTFKLLVVEVEKELGYSISITNDILLNYKIRKLFNLYESLTLEIETLPFIIHGTPYDFRCFEISHLLDVKNKNEETILAVDIHT